MRSGLIQDLLKISNPLESDMQKIYSYCSAHPREVLNIANATLAQDKSNPLAHLSLAWLYYNSGSSEDKKAIEHLQMLLELYRSPSAPTSVLICSYACIELNALCFDRNMDRIYAFYTDMIASTANPQLKALFYAGRGGLMSWEKDKIEEAKHDFAVAKEHDPACANAYAYSGELLLRLQDPMASVELDQALTLDPYQVAARFHRAYLYYMQGELEKAYVNARLVTWKKTGETVLLSGMILSAQGKTQKAIQQYQSIVNGFTMGRMGRVFAYSAVQLTRLHALDNSKALLSNYIHQLSSNNVNTLLVLAVCEEACQNNECAVNYLLRVILHEDFPKVYWLYIPEFLNMLAQPWCRFKVDSSFPSTKVQEQLMLHLLIHPQDSLKRRAQMANLALMALNSQTSIGAIFTGISNGVPNPSQAFTKLMTNLNAGIAMLGSDDMTVTTRETLQEALASCPLILNFLQYHYPNIFRIVRAMTLAPIIQTSTFLFAQQAKQDAARHIEQGIKHLNNNEHDQVETEFNFAIACHAKRAAKMLNQVLRDGDANTRSWLFFFRGKALLAQNDFTAQGDFFMAAEEGTVKKAAAYYYQAYILLKIETQQTPASLGVATDIQSMSWDNIVGLLEKGSDLDNLVDVKDDIREKLQHTISAHTLFREYLLNAYPDIHRKIFTKPVQDKDIAEEFSAATWQTNAL